MGEPPGRVAGAALAQLLRQLARNPREAGDAIAALTEVWREVEEEKAALRAELQEEHQRECAALKARTEQLEKRLKQLGRLAKKEVMLTAHQRVLDSAIGRVGDLFSQLGDPGGFGRRVAEQAYSPRPPSPTMAEVGRVLANVAQEHAEAVCWPDYGILMKVHLYDAHQLGLLKSEAVETACQLQDLESQLQLCKAQVDSLQTQLAQERSKAQRRSDAYAQVCYRAVEAFAQRNETQEQCEPEQSEQCTPGTAIALHDALLLAVAAHQQSVAQLGQRKRQKGEMEVVPVPVPESTFTGKLVAHLVAAEAKAAECAARNRVLETEFASARKVLTALAEALACGEDALNPHDIFLRTGVQPADHLQHQLEMEGGRAALDRGREVARAVLQDLREVAEREGDDAGARSALVQRRAERYIREALTKLLVDDDDDGGGSAMMEEHAFSRRSSRSPSPLGAGRALHTPDPDRRSAEPEPAPASPTITPAQPHSMSPSKRPAGGRSPAKPPASTPSKSPSRPPAAGSGAASPAKQQPPGSGAASPAKQQPPAAAPVAPAASPPPAAAPPAAAPRAPPAAEAPTAAATPAAAQAQRAETRQQPPAVTALPSAEPGGARPAGSPAKPQPTGSEPAPRAVPSAQPAAEPAASAAAPAASSASPPAPGTGATAAAGPAAQSVPDAAAGKRATSAAGAAAKRRRPEGGEGGEGGAESERVNLE
eukprot:TRINITY_DN3900_c0_g1_i2.p1 TRINITY_DN3900_c0_g1~~TRINITY_DN3900_c0_g1_i2.p1  ORF type:complete len:748 (+),score=154.45 TRINITY_DN3900_c0_g1_i2:114-2246(+)